MNLVRSRGARPLRLVRSAPRDLLGESPLYQLREEGALYDVIHHTLQLAVGSNAASKTLVVLLPILGGEI